MSRDLDLYATGMLLFTATADWPQLHLRAELGFQDRDKYAVTALSQPYLLSLGIWPDRYPQVSCGANRSQLCVVFNGRPASNNSVYALCDAKIDNLRGIE